MQLYEKGYSTFSLLCGPPTVRPRYALYSVSPSVSPIRPCKWGKRKAAETPKFGTQVEPAASFLVKSQGNQTLYSSGMKCTVIDGTVCLTIFKRLGNVTPRSTTYS